MARTRRLLIAAALLALVAGLTNPFDPPAPADSAGAGDCDELDVVTEVDGLPLCTHGTDDPGPTMAGPAGPAAAGTESGDDKVECYGDGEEGKRVVAIYAHPANAPNRYSQYVDDIQRWASDIDDVFVRSAARTGGLRHVRWQTDDACRVTVENVTLSRSGDNTFSNTIDELEAKGYDDANHKYFIWMDADVLCGIGTIYPHDQAGPGNWNELFTGYSRVDTSCWGFAEAHELMHNLGGVQPSAPNATPGYHCTDEWDFMCYDDDGSGGQSPVVRCSDIGLDTEFDCNNDDYFHTAPTGGNYLVDHWNTADSSWLENVPGTPPPPPANDDLAAAETIEGFAGSVSGTNAGATKEIGEANHGGDPGGSSIWYSWTPDTDRGVSLDTEGSGFDTTLAVYSGTGPSGPVLVAQNDNASGLGTRSRVSFTASAGTAYLIAVDGVGGTQGTVKLNHGAPPHDFDDVPGWVDDAVDWVAWDPPGSATPYASGYPDGTYRPDNDISRGQVTRMLYRIAGSPSVSGLPDHGFSDVPAWVDDAVTWIAHDPDGSGPLAPLATGYPDGTYRPDNDISRGQVTRMLYRIAGSPSVSGLPDHGFSDVPAWVDDAVTWIAHDPDGSGPLAPLATGYPDGTYRPDNDISRGQVTRMEFRLGEAEGIGF